MYSEVTSVYVPVKTPDYPLWAILLSGLVHVLLVGLLIFFHHTSAPPPMETSLITPEQLSDIEGQIKANQQNNQATSGDMSGAPSQTSTLSEMMPDVANPAHSAKNAKQIETVKNDLAAKEAQWRKEQALFAEKLDREVAAEQQNVIEEINQRSDIEQRNLRDYKVAEDSVDDIKNELRANAAAYNKNLNPKKDNQSDNSIKSFDLGKDGKSTGRGQSASQSLGGNGASRSGGASGGSSAGYVSQVKAIIDSHWNVPTNSNGKSLVASFSIAADGTISNINIRSDGDSALKASLQQAISQSSPLPPPPNGARTMSGNFKAN